MTGSDASEDAGSGDPAYKAGFDVRFHVLVLPGFTQRGIQGIWSYLVLLGRASAWAVDPWPYEQARFDLLSKATDGLVPFRSAGRRPGQAGRLCHPVLAGTPVKCAGQLWRNAPSPRPRQNPKILAPNGHSISLNAQGGGGPPRLCFASNRDPGFFTCEVLLASRAMVTAMQLQANQSP